jgi:hypothetical protein
MASGMSALSRILAELDQAKNDHTATIEELVTKAKQEIATEIARVRAIKEGDQGPLPIHGIHYTVPTQQEIVDEVMGLLPKVRNGKDADEEAIHARVLAQVRAELPETPSPEEIASLVLDLIIVPKAKDGTDSDPTGIIEEVLRRITEGNVLKPEHINGLPKTLKEFQARGSYVHGGGDTVVAGSNVTITKNAAGRKVIAATSGGFTTLTATETPDGTNTVFTFAAATAQPSFIIVDNVWLRATTKKGTVNWTWNAGTKKATLTIAAADEILGVV